jgi:hypothetical protein
LVSKCLSDVQRNLLNLRMYTYTLQAKNQAMYLVKHTELPVVNQPLNT